LGDVRGSRGRGAHADQNPANSHPHNIGVDRQNNACRGPQQPPHQVFDASGKILRMLHLNAPYDKMRHPVPATP
jgi:hypothetical protein